MPKRGEVTQAPREDLRELAARALSSQFVDLCQGAVIVDADARVVWINGQYPARLGIADPATVIGQPIEALIPNSLLRDVVESGQPMLLDIMDFDDASFVVSRLPLRDSTGCVIGAVGFMLYDDARHLAPVVSRYQRLCSDLAETRRKLGEARRTRYSFSAFIGAGQACTAVKQLARRAARTSAPVLILGETGTGKELLAQAIHTASPRANAPFVAVNIAAVPETLLEAEFFGVAPGAYTGADKRGRDGKFKLADGGTLLLDEIGDMSLALQAKLLRVLQEGEVEPVGSNRLQAVDVRIIAATSRNLEQMIAAGSFRADLYYRLNVITLNTPALRERFEDMPGLAECLLEQLCREQGLPVRSLSSDAIERLCQHTWPGNVRELANVLARALLLADGDSLAGADLDAVMPPAMALPAPEASLNLSRAVAQAERQAIAEALRVAAGNKVQAARLLGISRAALYEKLALHGVVAASD